MLFAGQVIFASSFLDLLKEKLKVFQPKDTVYFESRLETGESDGSKNFFSYKTRGAVKSTHKDKFDAVTGASVYNSTKKINELQFDSDKKTVLPKGLCKFFMFCVSEPNLQKIDSLKVESKPDGKVTVSFVHRGTYYLIESKENGVLDMQNCFYLQENVCENKGGKFNLPEDFVPLGKKPHLDDNNLENCHNEEELNEQNQVEYLTEDVPDAGANFVYQGNLLVTFDGKVVCIKGKLKKSEPVENEPEIIQETETTVSSGEAAEK